MQGLYTFLIVVEVALGFVLGIIILTQKSSGDGLIAKVNNPFTNVSGSVAPGVKFARILVGLFFINSFLIAVAGSKMHKKVSLIDDAGKPSKTEESIPLD